MSKFAWVTLTTNDTYSLGALVLAHSLRRAGTAHQLAVLVTPGVSESMRDKLKDVYNVVQEVNVLDSQDAANLALLARPELGITFTKLHCWRLVQFEKCVFLDSDTLVLQKCDELFDREELSAAPDVSWPDCFNSGVFVFKPSLDTFAKITEFALQHGSFDGGDQGLLNSYFADWAHSDIKKHLPFIYNVTAYASYCYLPAFKQFRDKIKILHFAGKMKPWLIQFNSESKAACTPTDYAHAADLIQLWWNIFCEEVHQKLTDNMNFWPAVLQWNFYKERYYEEQYKQQEYYHTHHYHQHSQEHHEHDYYRQERQFETDNIVEAYRDPWEDYYDNLEIERNEGNKQYTHEQVWFGMPEEDTTMHEVQARCETPPPPSYEACQHIIERIVSEPDHNTSHNNEAHNKHSHNNNRHAACETTQQEAAQVAHVHEVSSTNPHHCTDINADVRTPDESEVHNANTAKSEDLRDDNDNYCTTIAEAVSITEIETETEANEAGLAGALSQLRLGEQRSPEQEAYEQLMRRQCWESGQIDYAGKDSFDNIWKKIQQTLEEKPAVALPKEKDDDKSELLTSADIEDGKIEYDPATKARTQYKHIEGGYEMITTTPQPNGTLKTQVRTFWDPKPVSEEDLRKEVANRKLIRSKIGKVQRIDKNTTMVIREIEGGYEEVYTVINEDGTKSMRTKTFYDSVPEEELNNVPRNAPDNKPKNKRTVVRNSSVDSTDSTETRKTVQTQQKNVQGQQSNFKHQSTVEESRRVTQNIEYTENNRTVRKNSLQEQKIKAITKQSSVDNTDSKKKKKRSAIPPPPPDFIENDTTTVASKRVPGGVEYTYSTELESGKTITTTKTVYAEEELEMTEEEIREYKKTLKDAEKHKNVTTTKKLRSELGTKKIVPSENPGEVTTVETIRIEGGTEFHYTTVTAEGIVKKAVKTVYDPVPTGNTEEVEESEIVEEYEEEIIEPGEKNIRTIETIKKLPHKFEEEVTITHEKKEKKVKKSMVTSY